MYFKSTHLLKVLGLSLISLFLILFTCCKNGNTSKNKTKESEQKAVDKPQVEIMDLKNGTFNREILSNGKLYALRKAELRFQISEVLEKIYVKNGNRVQCGATLAILDNFTYKNSLNRSKTSFEKAKVDLQDVLIGQGYNTDDLTKVPVTVLKMSKIKSGYDNALYDLESAEHNYQSTFLKAPFSGIICSLKVKEKNLPGNEPICILVDNSCFNAEFSVLESELGNIEKGQKVEVIPFANALAPQVGVITEVNPLVDENGLVTVKAKVNNAGNILYEGMNVRVLINKAYPNCLVVPKQAIVLRSGKEVLFTYNNGLAKWHYVKTTDENSTSYVVTGDIEAGEKVIISGNLNLGSDAEVLVK